MIVCFGDFNMMIDGSRYDLKCLIKWTILGSFFVISWKCKGFKNV